MEMIPPFWKLLVFLPNTAAVINEQIYLFKKLHCQSIVMATGNLCVPNQQPSWGNFMSFEVVLTWSLGGIDIGNLLYNLARYSFHTEDRNQIWCTQSLPSQTTLLDFIWSELVKISSKKRFKMSPKSGYERGGWFVFSPCQNHYAGIGRTNYHACYICVWLDGATSANLWYKSHFNRQ